MSTHNMCFYGEIGKILCVYPLIWSCFFSGCPGPSCSKLNKLIVVKMLTVPVSTISNSRVFLLKKM